MADVFVTLVAIQPVVAARAMPKTPFNNRPQGQQRSVSGVYAARRKRQVLRSKPNGAK